jgi:Na+-driven multidrug efflux pump
VGGLVMMFALINGSLTSITQRFLNFELGKKNEERLKQIFSASLSIHIILSIVILLAGETVGLWFLNTQLNIAPERMIAANWVYQCSLITFIVNLISLPYNAVIIAREKMDTFAYVSILDTFLKLCIVFPLKWIKFDQLVGYAILMLLVAIIICLIYGRYCGKRYSECSFEFCRDKTLYREITSFAGWTFIGNSSALLMSQGVNILLNVFCGVAVNAARGIAVQAGQAVNSFVTNFMTALNPQITKSYASGNHKYMMTLVQQGSKFSFYLLLLLSLPVIMETETILSLWLKTVPDYTVIFLRLALVYALLQTLSATLTASAAATGKIKKYQIVVGGIQSLNFPISLLFLYLKFEPQAVYLIAIILSCSCLTARLRLLRNLVGLSVAYYVRHVIFNVVTVAVLSSAAPFLLLVNMDGGIIRLFAVGTVSVLSSSLVILFVGCSKNERKTLYSQITSVKNKLKK